MDPLRKEVQEFVRLAEMFLTPHSLGQPLNPEERKFIEHYARSLVDHGAADGRSKIELAAVECLAKWRAERNGKVHQ
jgi:hypothetical protein